jgi:hypothetical protein
MTDKVYQYDFKEVVITDVLKRHLRIIELKDLESIKIMRIGEDLVLADGRVPSHTDGTIEGKDTIMLIILADNGYSFNHENCYISIKSGDIVRFNGNRLHGLNCDNIKGRFAAIIWDVPITAGIDDLLFDLKKRLGVLNKEAAKLNINK